MALDPKWMHAFDRDQLDTWLIVTLFCVVSLAFLHFTGMGAQLPIWVVPVLWLGLILSICVYAVHILGMWLQSRE